MTDNDEEKVIEVLKKLVEATTSDTLVWNRLGSLRNYTVSIGSHWLDLKSSGSGARDGSNCRLLLDGISVVKHYEDHLRAHPGTRQLWDAFFDAAEDQQRRSKEDVSDPHLKQLIKVLAEALR
jgi:hypothetical protein